MDSHTEVTTERTVHNLYEHKKVSTQFLRQLRLIPQKPHMLDAVCLQRASFLVMTYECFPNKQCENELKRSPVY